MALPSEITRWLCCRLSSNGNDSRVLRESCLHLAKHLENESIPINQKKRSATETPPKLISNRKLSRNRNRTEATMDDLPELPFEKVLSYLSLEDRLKARAVSRRWYHKINSFRVKSLCYSSRSSDFIRGKIRWVSGPFAENFVSTTRFTSFFDTFGRTILSSLKHLRLCDLNLTEGDPTAFARTLNSLDQLQKLDIIRAELNLQDVLNLNLPMLTSLQLEDVHGIGMLTLEAPRLQQVKILGDYRTILRMEIVHGESVERLFVDGWGYTDMKKLKNLQFLYAAYLPGLDPTFLSSLQHLKEIHTNHPRDVSQLFEQKQRLGRVDLKIYLYGLLLNGPHDPARNVLRNSLPSYLAPEAFVCLAENPSRLADEILFYRTFYYSEIEAVAPSLDADLLKRFTDWDHVAANDPVRDTQRFLDLLKNWENISKLSFSCDQPQDLFDRLPEHCAIQDLTLYCPPSDLAFLFRLKHLIRLHVGGSIRWPIETVRRAFDELPALSCFTFRYGQKRASIRIGQSKQFKACFGSGWMTFIDLNAAIEFITGIER